MSGPDGSAEKTGSERKSLILRIEPRLHDAIRRLAETELRSVNAQIEFLLREALRARKAFGDMDG